MKHKREFLYPLAELSGVRGLPENFWLMDANGAFLARVFFDCLLIFPKIVCKFCLQISDRRYKHDSGGGDFALSVQDHKKSKREFFILPQ